MKSFYRIGVLLAVAALFLAACGDDRVVSEQPAEGGAAAEAETDDTRGADTSSLEDGVYIAGEEFDPEADWRNIVMLEVSGEEITAAEWNAAPKRGGPAKLQHSISGDYGMEAVSDWAWNEHADALARYVVENQTFSEIPRTDEGRPDGITGATIRIGSFVTVGNKALEQADS